MGIIFFFCKSYYTSFSASNCCLQLLRWNISFFSPAPRQSLMFLISVCKITRFKSQSNQVFTEQRKAHSIMCISLPNFCFLSVVVLNKKLFEFSRFFGQLVDWLGVGFWVIGWCFFGVSVFVCCWGFLFLCLGFFVCFLTGKQVCFALLRIRNSSIKEYSSHTPRNSAYVLTCKTIVPDPVFRDNAASVNIDTVAFLTGLMLDAQRLASWRLSFQEGDFFLQKANRILKILYVFCLIPVCCFG